MVKDGPRRRSGRSIAPSRASCARSSWPGLFEQPFVDADAAERATNTAAPARRSRSRPARKSIVLLKNDQAAVLPLDRARLKTLAVIGPNAKGLHLGGYSSDPGRGVDIAGRHHRQRPAPACEVALRRRRPHHRARRRTGPPTRWCCGDRGQEPRAHPGGGHGRAPGRRDRPRHRHQRVHVARGVGRQPPRRRRRPVAHEPAGGAGRRDAADRQAGGRRAQQRPAARGARRRGTRAGDPRSLVRRTRKAAPRSARCSSATSTPAASCRSRFPREHGPAPGLLQPAADARSATTWTSTREPLWAFGFGLSYTTFALDEPARSNRRHDRHRRHGRR